MKRTGLGSSLGSLLKVTTVALAVVLLCNSLMCYPAIGQESKPTKAKEPKPFRWVNPLPKKHHPAIVHATFESPSAKREIGYCISLPPSYKEDTANRYPVVYYLHGGRPGGETKSIRLASYLYDAWQADQVAPAIYVFVNGGPVSHYDMPDQEIAPAENAARKGAHIFVNELIPHIDATYRTIAKRSGRAIEGFSQGGRGTMRIALKYPEMFCSAAAGGGGYETEKKISESNGYERPDLKFAEGENAWDRAKAYSKAETPRLRLMIYVGDEGFNYQNNLQYSEYLKSLGIKHQLVVVPGVKHSAADIYLKKAVEIMSFHQVNFMEASTINSTDGARGLPTSRTR